MAQKISKVVLFGLSVDLMAELERALLQQSEVMVYAQAFAPGTDALGFIRSLDADLVFCPAEPERCQPLLETLRQSHINLPVVVVSRQPEVSSWLGALEAGAQDYCAPPFEFEQIRWILEAAVRTQHAPGIRS